MQSFSGLKIFLHFSSFPPHPPFSPFDLNSTDIPVPVLWSSLYQSVTYSWTSVSVFSQGVGKLEVCVSVGVGVRGFGLAPVWAIITNYKVDTVWRCRLSSPFSRPAGLNGAVVIGGCLFSKWWWWWWGEAGKIDSLSGYRQYTVWFSGREKNAQPHVGGACPHHPPSIYSLG